MVCGILEDSFQHLTNLLGVSNIEWKVMRTQEGLRKQDCVEEKETFVFARFQTSAHAHIALLVGNTPLVRILK